MRKEEGDRDEGFRREKEEEGECIEKGLMGNEMMGVMRLRH